MQRTEGEIRAAATARQAREQLALSRARQEVPTGAIEAECDDVWSNDEAQCDDLAMSIELVPPDDAFDEDCESESASDDCPMLVATPRPAEWQLCGEVAVTRPKDDAAAVDAAHQLFGDRWKTVNGDLHVYNEGVWQQDANVMKRLLMDRREELGVYGTTRSKMNDVIDLAKTMNVVDDAWTQQLDQLRSGLVPFADGIYDRAAMTIRAFTPEDKLTTKLDFNAPREDVRAERREVEQLLRDMLPDRLYNELLGHVAESLFSSTNSHKYFVQLYGDGNNGKTTLMSILSAAFPQWVRTTSVEHFVVKGGNHDSNRPQPWLIDVRGARIVFVEEPNNRAFDGSLLKLLRGNGAVTGRALYKGNVSYVPTWTLYIAANDPIETKPSDPAVRASMRSFHLPCHFSANGRAPHPYHRFPRKSIANVAERFTQRAYRIALLEVLWEHWDRYEADGLPPLESEFSRPLAQLYKDDHPSIRDLFARCFEENEQAMRVPEKELLHKLEAEGCTESQKKMKLTMEEHYKPHAFVRRYQHRKVYHWDGLEVRGGGFGGEALGRTLSDTW